MKKKYWSFIKLMVLGSTFLFTGYLSLNSSPIISIPVFLMLILAFSMLFSSVKKKSRDIEFFKIIGTMLLGGIIISFGFIYMSSTQPITANMQGIMVKNADLNYQIGVGMLVSGLIIFFQSIVEIYVYLIKIDI
jgi:hypothetical protein